MEETPSEESTVGGEEGGAEREITPAEAPAVLGEVDDARRTALRERLIGSKVVAGTNHLLEDTLFEALAGEDPVELDRLESTWEVKRRDLRVRIGTLLKSDHVSILAAAGCSMGSGGVSLASLPVVIEFEVVRSFAGGDGSIPAAVRLLYAAADSLGEDAVDQEDRVQTIRDSDLDAAAKKLNPIKVNVEQLLSRLHAWSQAAQTGHLAQESESGDLEEVAPDNIAALIRAVNSSLAKTCRLPKAGKDAETHREFVRRVLTRPTGLHRISIFTSNYDTLFEQALDAEGVVTLDGFTGRVNPTFRPDSYDHDLYFPTETTEGRVNRLDRVARLYKLHGSTTWTSVEPTATNPFGVAYRDEREEPGEDLLIYPTPLKFNESLGMPYAEMFRRFASAVVRPQSVLFVLGYSFGDDHINAIIFQAMAIPSFTLVIVNPDPGPDAESFLQAGDERIWSVTGPLGEFEKFTEELLPDLQSQEIDRKVAETFRSLSAKDGGR